MTHGSEIITDSMEPKRPSVRELAGEIRSTLSVAVTDGLEDAFPKNWEWRHGPYDLVYVRGEIDYEAYDFYGGASMAALYPNGEIRTGKVKSYIGSDHSYLKFKEAKMQPADDLEVVYYGPKLLEELDGQVRREVKDQTEPKKIEKMLSFLDTEPTVAAQVSGLSEKAIAIIHGTDDESDQGDTGTGIISLDATIEEAETKRQKEIQIYRSALILFKNKNEIIGEFDNLSRELDGKKLHEQIQAFVQLLDEYNLFPIRGKSFTALDQEWYPNPNTNQHLYGRLRPRYAKQGNNWWAISDHGDIREVNGSNGNPTVLEPDPLHVTKEAPWILSHLIDVAVADVYPKLGEKTHK